MTDRASLLAHIADGHIADPLMTGKRMRDAGITALRIKAWPPWPAEPQELRFAADWPGLTLVCSRSLAGRGSPAGRPVDVDLRPTPLPGPEETRLDLMAPLSSRPTTGGTASRPALHAPFADRAGLINRVADEYMAGRGLPLDHPGGISSLYVEVGPARLMFTAEWPDGWTETCGRSNTIQAPPGSGRRERPGPARPQPVTCKTPAYDRTVAYLLAAGTVIAWLLALRAAAVTRDWTVTLAPLTVTLGVRQIALRLCRQPPVPAVVPQPAVPACLHTAAVPVESWPPGSGQVVAYLCPACDTQLPAGWRP